MESHDPLMMGMFWGGLLVASVPILLSVGIGVYVLRRTLASRREATGPRPRDSEPHPTAEPGGAS